MDPHIRGDMGGGMAARCPGLPRRGAGNVTWLLTLNVGFPDSGPVSAYWPGAAYVDWIGIDGYYVRPGATFKSVPADIRAVRKLTSKLVLISETAVGPIAGQVRGIRNLFAAVRRHGLTGLSGSTRRSTTGSSIRTGGWKTTPRRWRSSGRRLETSGGR